MCLLGVAPADEIQLNLMKQNRTETHHLMPDASRSSPPHPPTPLPIPTPMAAIAIRVPLPLAQLIPSLTLDPHRSRRLSHLLVESPLLCSLLCDLTPDAARAVATSSHHVDDEDRAHLGGMEAEWADEVAVRAEECAPAHAVDFEVESAHLFVGLGVWNGL